MTVKKDAAICLSKDSLGRKTVFFSKQREKKAEADTLFYKGNPSLLLKPIVCIIGSRKATQPGKAIAWQIARSHVNSGWSVLSGLCRGIDEWAHMGSLPNSIAAIPHGIAKFTPKTDTHSILKRGGLAISPFQPTMETRKWTYPIRNELMVALADRVILVQAIDSRGAIKTARRAAGCKPLFIVDWKDGSKPIRMDNSISVDPQELSKGGFSKSLNMTLCRPPTTIEEIAAERQWSIQEAASRTSQWLTEGRLTWITNGLYGWTA